MLLSHPPIHTSAALQRFRTLNFSHHVNARIQVAADGAGSAADFRTFSFHVGREWVELHLLQFGDEIGWSDGKLCLYGRWRGVDAERSVEGEALIEGAEG